MEQRHHYAGFWIRAVAYAADAIILPLLGSIVGFIVNVIAGLFATSLDYGSAVSTTGFSYSEQGGAIDLDIDINYDKTVFPIEFFLFMMMIVARFLIGSFYFSVFESSQIQGTIGKRVVGLKVIDTNGNKLSFTRASGRYLAKIVSLFTLCIGFFMIGWTQTKQGLHDKLVSTLVIYR